jgi:Protein kinase domain
VTATCWTGDGRPLALGDELGRGGEGAVYKIQGDSRLAVKLFDPRRRSHELWQKIEVMARTAPAGWMGQADHPNLAWVQDVVYLDPGRSDFGGFAMPRLAADSFQEAHIIFDPADRVNRFGGELTWEHLLGAAENLASVVEAVHQKGHRVGDLRESNVMVGKDTRLTLIDCDSFEIYDEDTGRRFYTRVGTPDYLPPELQQVDFAARGVERYHADLFALAVLIFKFLMEGAHPFQGQGGPLQHASTPQQKIMLGIFPYEANADGVTPPPHAPPLRILPPEVARLTRRCFVAGHRHPTERPSAATWHTALAAALQEVKACEENSNHRFGGHLRACPWCDVRRRTGRDPFPPPLLAGQQRPGIPVASSLADREEEFRQFVRAAVHDGQLSLDKRDQVEQRREKLALTVRQARTIVDAELQRSRPAWPPGPTVPSQPGAPTPRWSGTSAPGSYGPPLGYSTGRIQLPPPSAQPDPDANTALGMAVLSIFCCGPVFAPVALFKAHGVATRIERSGGALSGLGRVRAAQVIAGVVLAGYALWLLLMLTVGTS